MPGLASRLFLRFPPSIEIISDNNNGTGATAQTNMRRGYVTGITITSGGKGYTNAPFVVIHPSPNDTYGCKMCHMCCK